MSVFNIIRFRKIKTDVEIRHAENHNFRRVDVLNANAEKSNLNRYYGETPTFQEKFNSLRERYNLKVREKGQNASVKAIEFVISASPGFFKGKSEREILKYFADNLDILKTHFFKESGSLVSFAIHYDETTPHLHAIYVPILKKGDSYSLSCKDLLGGKQKCILLQDIVHSELVKRGWDVSRGKRHQKPMHNDIQKFYTKINDTRDEYNEIVKQNKTFSHYIVEKGLSNDFKQYLSVNPPSENLYIKPK